MSKSSVCGGGQRRTLVCVCGFVAKGAPREANMRMKMHQKKCEDSSDIPIDETFNPLRNGMDGFTHTRNGNLVQRQMQAVVSTPEDQTTMSVEDFMALQQLQNILRNLD